VSKPSEAHGGTQHFSKVEEIEHSNHVTATGERYNLYVGKFSSQRGGSLQTIPIGHEKVQNDQVG